MQSGRKVTAAYPAVPPNGSMNVSARENGGIKLGLRKSTAFGREEGWTVKGGNTGQAHCSTTHLTRISGRGRGGGHKQTHVQVPNLSARLSKTLAPIVWIGAKRTGKRNRLENSKKKGKHNNGIRFFFAVVRSGRGTKTAKDNESNHPSICVGKAVNSEGRRVKDHVFVSILSFLSPLAPLPAVRFA